MILHNVARRTGALDIEALARPVHGCIETGRGPAGNPSRAAAAPGARGDDGQSHPLLSRGRWAGRARRAEGGSGATVMHLCSL
eukprot:8291870-Pyramimonas_sp.AAC.1